MKKYFIFIISVLFLACSNNLPEPPDEINCEEWDYPVKPGMEEWGLVTKTYEERVKVCQIPENILYCVSTERLLDLCLQNPLFFNAWAYDYFDRGLDHVFRVFNGLPELYQREDMVHYLIKRYQEKIQSLDSTENKEDPLRGRFDFAMSIQKLDAMFSRVEQQESLKEILQNLVIGYERYKEIDMPTFGRDMFKFNYFSRAHVIIKICEPCLEEIPYGKNNTVFLPTNVIWEPAYDIVDQLSYQLIK